MFIRSKYKLLCLKAVRNQISEDDLHILNSWLKRSEKHQIYFSRLKDTWEKVGSVRIDPPAPDIKQEWESFKEMLNRKKDEGPDFSVYRTAISKSLNSFTSTGKFLIRKPAYIVLFMMTVISISAYVYFSSPAQEIQTQTFTAANKQKVNVQLSDGSSIQLNSGSSLTVLDKPSKQNKEIRLDGEAYFEMAEQKSPCSILTDNARIEIIGTAFNVWSRNNITRVIVKKGLVRLSPVGLDKKQVILGADQMSRVVENQNPANIKAVNAEKYIGWPDGKLVFIQCPLDEMVAEIERQYDVSITIPSEKLIASTITATFENMPVEDVLYSVCLALQLEYINTSAGSYVLTVKQD